MTCPQGQEDVLLRGQGWEARTHEGASPPSWGHGSAMVPAVGSGSWARPARAVLSSHLAKWGQHPFSQLGSWRLVLGSGSGGRSEGQSYSSSLGAGSCPCRGGLGPPCPWGANSPPSASLRPPRSPQRLQQAPHLPSPARNPSSPEAHSSASALSLAGTPAAPPALSPAPGPAPRCKGYSRGESQEELAPHTSAKGAP